MNISLILQRKFPGTQWILTGDSYDGLEWLDESVKKPTEAALKKLAKDVEAEEAVEQVTVNRRNAYRAFVDDLFFEYQAGEIEESVWLDARAAVKEQFPYSV